MKNKEKYCGRNNGECTSLDIALPLSMESRRDAAQQIQIAESCTGNKPGYCNREEVIEWAESEYVRTIGRLEVMCR